jgi:hypothetical protein
MITYSQTAAAKAARGAKFTVELMEPERVVLLSQGGDRFLDIRKTTRGWLAVRRERDGGFDAHSSVKFFKEKGFDYVGAATIERLAELGVDKYASPAQAIRDCAKRRNARLMGKPHSEAFAQVLADKPIR